MRFCDILGHGGAVLSLVTCGEESADWTPSNAGALEIGSASYSLGSR